MAACVAVVEAEEALLQIYALQWRAIELRSQQLQNQCRQVELDEELDREERDLLREHEQLLRMREKQLVQQQYEERFKLRVAEATTHKLQQQQQSEQVREAVASTGETDVLAIATTTTTKKTATMEIKRKSKATVASGAGEEQKNKKPSAIRKANGNEVVKRMKSGVKKSVAFSPRKPIASAISQPSSAATRRRSLEESFNEETVPGTTSKSTSAADELMRMLSADKASDSEGDEPSLLLSFSPRAVSSERRYLSYGSPSKATTKGSSNDTPSKFTPSKLARSVVQKAMAAPLDFDFTRKAQLARAKAAREKREVAAKNGESDSSDDEGAADATETPSKKALKRRKDLGISLSTKPSAASKAKAKTASEAAKPTAAATGGKSLMEMISAASLVEAKLSKPKEAAAVQLKKTSAASSAEQGRAPRADEDHAKEPAASGKTAKAKKSAAAEPESEEFIGLQTANITKRAKPKQSVKSAKASSALPVPAGNPEPEADDVVEPRKVGRPKKKEKLNAVELAIAKADMLTRMSKMQDIATPKVAGKKTKKVLAKTTATALAAKRAEFQKILADGVSSEARDTDGDDIGEDAATFETPRKARAMKRKRATDLPGQADADVPAKKPTAAAPQPQASYLQSPSVAALLAMRPSKSPIGIRYVPKTPKTQQSIRKPQRSADDDDDAPSGAADGMSSSSLQGMNPGLVTRAKKITVKAARNAFAGTTGALTSAAGGLWGNSGPSFFDKFVGGGAPRLKRTALP